MRSQALVSSVLAPSRVRGRRLGPLPARFSTPSHEQDCLASLSRLFRRLFLEKLVAAHTAGQLQFFSTSRRDFVPWRFSAAGRYSARLDRRRRRLKTCTEPDIGLSNSSILQAS